MSGKVLKCRCPVTIPRLQAMPESGIFLVLFFRPVTLGVPFPLQLNNNKPGVLYGKEHSSARVFSKSTAFDCKAHANQVCHHLVHEQLDLSVMGIRTFFFSFQESLIFSKTSMAFTVNFSSIEPGKTFLI